MSLPPSYSEFSFNVEPVDTLPSYTTGAEVRPVVGPPQQSIPSLLRIDLSPECSSGKYFDLGDIIHGHLVIAPRTPLQVAQLSVAFGYDEVVKQHSWISDTITKKYGRLGEYIVPKASLPGGMDDAILLPGMEYSFPFAVQVPELQALDNCRHQETESTTAHLRLPPSLGSALELNVIADNIENNDARVVYKLVAIVRSIDSLEQPLFQATKYIRVVPSYTVAPHDMARVTTEHPYAKNFELLPRRFLKKKLFRGTVNLTLSRFAAIPMHAPMIATLTVTAIPAEAGVPPPAITNVFFKLNAYTGYLNEPPKYNSFGLITLRGPAIKGLEWLPDADAKMVTQIALPVKLPQVKLITPTFASCIISRWYTLTISVVLGDNSLMALEVPVNVVADLQARSAVPYAVGMPAPIYQEPDSRDNEQNDASSRYNGGNSSYYESPGQNTNWGTMISNQQQGYEGSYSCTNYNNSLKMDYSSQDAVQLNQARNRDFLATS